MRNAKSAESSASLTRRLRTTDAHTFRNPQDVAIESTFGTELITATGEETTKFVHDSVLSIPVPKPEGAAEEDPAPKPVKYDRSGKFFFQDPDPEEEEGAGA